MGLYRITVTRPYRTTELMLEAGMSVEVASTVNPIQSTNVEMKKVVDAFNRIYGLNAKSLPPRSHFEVTKIS